jgi:hypothetical protein
MLEPTDDQWAALEEIQGPFALVQFIVIKNQNAMDDYLSASERTVQSVGAAHPQRNGRPSSRRWGDALLGHHRGPFSRPRSHDHGF